MTVPYVVPELEIDWSSGMAVVLNDEGDIFMRILTPVQKKKLEDALLVVHYP